MVRRWSPAALARRKLRAAQLGYLQPKNACQKILLVGAQVAERVRGMANSLEWHDRHDSMTGYHHHYARNALEAASSFITADERRAARRAHRLANQCKHGGHRQATAHGGLSETPLERKVAELEKLVNRFVRSQADTLLRVRVMECTPRFGVDVSPESPTSPPACAASPAAQACSSPACHRSLSFGIEGDVAGLCDQGAVLRDVTEQETRHTGSPEIMKRLDHYAERLKHYEAKREDIEHMSYEQRMQYYEDLAEEHEVDEATLNALLAGRGRQKAKREDEEYMSYEQRMQHYEDLAEEHEVDEATLNALLAGRGRQKAKREDIEHMSCEQRMQYYEDLAEEHEVDEATLNALLAGRGRQKAKREEPSNIRPFSLRAMLPLVREVRENRLKEQQQQQPITRRQLLSRPDALNYSRFDSMGDDSDEGAEHSNDVIPKEDLEFMASMLTGELPPGVTGAALDWGRQNPQQAAKILQTAAQTAT